ncbi:MAG: tRNA pseudouridine(38-40) synthase TruA [Flavobacteriaceae bacterium]
MNQARFFVEFSYHGAPFHGWQRQPNAPSVQEVMESAFELLLKTPCPITAAGRTDTGVHARYMVAHFDAPIKLIDLEELPFRVNQILPKEIAIQSIKGVKPDAHARFDALFRTYEYHIATIKTPFNNDFVHTLYQSIDLDLMNQAASLLLSYSDFECFSKSNTDVKTYLCKLTYAQWSKTENGYVFTITANRFLRNMVRAIVGTLLEIGLHKKKLDDLDVIIKSKNRSLAGYSVPAKGLFLTQIQYPETLYI